ncbi:ABC transporter permease [Roseivirga sp. UBA838]|uniref:ABC transporter permease n=1 Tax=Roseivirga sp. UBA838 TaxID=1947393 RepID=UPI00257AE96F|nr:ABC transporter permease [Roseivirga sp. UBA838]
MKNKNNIPPRWADRFLEWYCKPQLLEDLQGDLYEHFERHLSSKGARKARWLYALNTLRFFKPYTVKKLNFLNQLTQFIMFKNYFKTSIRSIARNKLFSAINIFGLAVSMSVCLIMITMFVEVKNYDRFHHEAERIFRINNTHSYLESDPSLFASTSILVGKRMKEEVPGLKAITIMSRGFNGDGLIGDKRIPISGFWADEDFFNVLSFELYRGDPATALKAPYSIVLTEETANKFFGEADPMGKTITVAEHEYQVTGLVKNPPFNSHMDFQSLVSFSTFEIENEDNRGFLSWQNMWSNYVYFRLDDQTDIADIENRLNAIAADENSESKQVNIQLAAQPITKIMLGPSNTSNQLGPSIGREVIWVFAGLAFVVILSAGFNYTNLSIARSLRRAKEVGVRKVVGAQRKQVFTQFIVEACLISLASLIMAYFIFFLIRPMFLNLNPEIQSTLRLEHEPIVLVYFIAFALLVGFFAGFLPSLFLSKLKAIQVLKSASGPKAFSKINLRKALIVIQFTLSLMFIISASISHRQFKYALNFNLGFDTENVLNIDLQNNDPQLTKAMFEQIPEVTDIAKSSHILSIGSRWANQVKSDDGLDSASVYYSSIDHRYIPLMKHRLLAGSNFPEKNSVEVEESMIVNEQFIKHFKLGSPEEAIGESLKFGRERLTIVGVVENFHYATLDSEIECFAFRHKPQEARMLSLKISSNDLLSTRKKIEEAWAGFDEVHDFKGYFYKDGLERAYEQFSVTYTLVGFLAFLTICIASLGLLGMGVYTAETRLKEISIRKVLGATEGSLITLLSRGFMLLLLLATAIAVPATYYLFDELILADQANRANIGLLELSLGVIIIFGIGFLTIGSQTWKAARSNPALTLRNE